MASESSLARAQEHFARLLQPGSKDLLGRFLALCEDHPDLDADLRKIWDDFQGVRRDYDLSTRGLAFHLARRTPDGQELPPTLDDPMPGEAPMELLERLGARAALASRYDVEGELGRGGMGMVLRTWDRDLRRHLAMKVVRTNYPRDVSDSTKQKLARFLDEAQVTAQLEHPCVVPLHDIGMDPHGRVFFTMRLIQGQELLRVFDLVRLERDGWTLTRALGVLLRVCEAMAFAHSKGVIHRDLKPSNVMTGRFGEVYVVDWGVAKVLDRQDAPAEEPLPELFLSSVHTERNSPEQSSPDSRLVTTDGTIIGTPAYMSPEQAAGRVSNLTPAADIYSLGAVLYHLLSGQPPYIGPKDRIAPEVVAARVIDGPPVPLGELRENLPAELEAICTKAMARKPRERYESMAAMADDLRAFLEGRVVGAFEHGAWAELKKWFGRNRMLAGTIVGALLISMLSLGAFAWTAQHNSRLIEVALFESALNRHLGLVQEADELWPAVPAQVPALNEWIDSARDMVAELPTFERALEDSDDAQRVERLRRVVTGLRQLGATGGLLDQVVRRRDRAEALPKITLTDERPAAAWDDARASIADPTSSPRYAGLAIEPQLGLLPIRRDPESGLWEFSHVPSGEPVSVNDAGQLALTERSAIVLVLVPGATVSVVGVDVQLEPFFISKYEVTQGQWRRFTGQVRSRHRDLSLLHPVESLDWFDCEGVFGRLGLTLPTELQWEYAATGGRMTAEPPEEPAGWAEQANLKGASGPLDVYPVHARVGSFPPNGFGLHDCYGNVWEWVLDSKSEPRSAPRSGDGLRPGGDALMAYHRGGSFDSSPEGARHESYPDFKDARSQYLGARPSRPLER